MRACFNGLIFNADYVKVRPCFGLSKFWIALEIKTLMWPEEVYFPLLSKSI